MTPTFSVVVPAYNAAGTVAATMRSVQQQTLRDFELIVVDDGSNDETPDVVAAVADERTVVVTQANAGLAGARNAGIERARGTFVAFLDADDLYAPGYLAAAEAAFEREPGAGAAYVDGWVLHGATGRVRRTSVLAYMDPPTSTIRDTDWLLRRLLRANFLISAVAIRRTVLEDVGTFRTDLAAVEDYELWLRVVAHGHYFARMPGRLLVRRDLEASMSKDFAMMADNRLRVLEIVLDEYVLSTEQRAAALRRRAQVEQQRRDYAVDRSFSLRREALSAARWAKRVTVGRRLWLERQPSEVAELLRAVGDPLADVS